MKPRLTAYIIIVCALSHLAWDATMAATAAFAADGQTVFAIKSDPSNQIERIDIASGAVTPINVVLGKDDIVEGIAHAGNGEFYLVTKHALWQWKPGIAKAHWIEAAPEKTELIDIACNSQNGDILIATLTPTEAGFCYKRSGGKRMVSVGIRYPPAHTIECPVFLPDGSFLFGTYGDLWHGLIERTTESDDPDGQWTRENLVAYRYAPIAQRETYDGTPIQTGIADIAVSRKKAYVNFRRMGGSGWGSICRLDLPVQEHGTWRSLNTAKDAVRVLASFEEVAMTSGGWVRLCGSPDGHQVYYGDGSGPIRKNSLIVGDAVVKP